MSIATKKGDTGATTLMYNRRVSKTDPRVEACGNLDELNAALGQARATATEDFVQSHLLQIQADLITIMGELATSTEDLERYEKDGYKRVTPEMYSKLDKLVTDIEKQKISFAGWATPGSSLNSAALDLARAICRRAERSVCHLVELEEVQNGAVLIYLNRLSDVLWLMARWIETALAKGPGTSLRL